MKFVIEATVPTAPADLQKVLEAARDEWIATAEQPHAPESPEAKALDTALSKIARARGKHKDEPYPNDLSDAVAAHRALIKAHSANPLPDMVGAIAQINLGIELAVAAASKKSHPVRVTIDGHFYEKPKTIHGGHERLSVKIDDAKLG